jgi:hypothetical protein
MKFYIILVVSLVLGFSISNSQVVIQSSDVTLTNGQTIYQKNLNASVFSGFEVGTDKQWDFSAAGFVGETMTLDFVTPPVNPEFSTATHATLSMFGFPSIGYVVPTATYYELNQDGYFELGNYHQATYIPLNQDGSNNANVEDQNSLFLPAPRLAFPMPLVYNESETNTPAPVKRTIQMEINVPAAGLEDAPFDYARIEMLSYQTVGWGKIKLPGYENEEDVIVVERLRSQVDSFYLYSQPAPEMLLTAFGLQQGSTSNFRTLFFFAKGYPQPILNLSLNAEGQVTNAFQIAYDLTMSVDNQDLSSYQPNVFPNPSNGEFTVDTKDYADANFIEVYSMNGELLLKKNLEAGSTQSTFRLINAPSGSYIFSINNESGRSLSSGKLMITK